MTAADSWDNLVPRLCPVCGSGPADSTKFLKQSFDSSRINCYSYASRKLPEFMRFELVTCLRCKTVYATSAPSQDLLARAYHEAQYDSAEEAKLAAQTYDEALSPYLTTLSSRLRALEIGTGTGAFLSHLQRAGFSEVVGIEPSWPAINAAETAVRPLIRKGIFVGDEFPAEYFDLICCFQTLEHVPKPRILVEACTRLLRQGGLLALVTHNYRAPVNRLLGRRSPIIDIEHLQLFCRPSLDRLFSTAGLETVTIKAFSNRYRLTYWLRLTPLPTKFKSTVTHALNLSGVGELEISLNVGNLLSIGRKTK